MGRTYAHLCIHSDMNSNMLKDLLKTEHLSRLEGAIIRNKRIYAIMYQNTKNVKRSSKIRKYQKTAINIEEYQN